MENKVLGKVSEQKEAWKEIWNGAWSIYSYFIDGKQTWGQIEGRGIMHTKSRFPPTSLV